jgi:Fe-S-cluster containining protein
MTAPTDCRRCGACCFSASPMFVRVSGDDWARLGDRAPELAHFIGHRAFMRMRDGHCVALDVRSARNGMFEYFCTTYDARPQICRDLARGSAECDAERETKGAMVAGRGRSVLDCPRSGGL